MKVKWISKQYSRFDLALTKVSRPMIAINTISNLTVAVVVGILVFGAIALVGFLGIAFLGYIFHRAGFFMETMNETFDQQSKQLTHRTIKLTAVYIVKFDRLSNEDLETEYQKIMKELRL